MAKKEVENFGLLDGLGTVEIEETEFDPTIEPQVIEDLEGLPVRYESTYLSFTRKPRPEEAEAVMIGLAHMQKKSPLYLGDATGLLKRMFSETWSQFIPEELSKKTLINYARVCELCPPSMRVEGLDLGHYEAAKSIPKEERQDFINQCAEEGWTVPEARKMKAEWLGKQSKPKEKANKEGIIVCVERVARFLETVDNLPEDVDEAIGFLKAEVRKI